jgi:soluble P-type ATPase
MRIIHLPGARSLELESLVFDLNGTLSNRGELIEGVAVRLRSLARDLELHLVTADTFGTAGRLAGELGMSLTPVSSGSEKASLVRELGADHTAAIGNGRNDEAMFRAAALSIAVIGPEGAATCALATADVVCGSILEALDLLLEDQALVATLRP